MFMNLVTSHRVVVIRVTSALSLARKRWEKIAARDNADHHADEVDTTPVGDYLRTKYQINVSYL